MIQTIDGLAALAGRYDVLLSDVWGVIHNGRESFAGPCAALARWRAEVGPVVLISNAARPSAPVAEQLDGLGVPRAAWSALVTSGDVTRTLLAERAPGPAYRIGAGSRRAALRRPGPGVRAPRPGAASSPAPGWSTTRSRRRRTTASCSPPQLSAVCR